MRGDTTLKNLGIVFLFLGLFNPICFIVGGGLLLLYLRPDILDSKDNAPQQPQAPVSTAQSHQPAKNADPLAGI